MLFLLQRQQAGCFQPILLSLKTFNPGSRTLSTHELTQRQPELNYFFIILHPITKQ